MVNAAAKIQTDPDFKKEIVNANKELPQDKQKKLDENAIKEAYNQRLTAK